MSGGGPGRPCGGSTAAVGQLAAVRGNIYSVCAMPQLMAKNGDKLGPVINMAGGVGVQHVASGGQKVQRLLQVALAPEYAMPNDHPAATACDPGRGRAAKVAAVGST